MRSKILWAIIILSFLGFADAAYLTFSHYYGTEVECSILKGCETVLNSKYAAVYGISVALLGVVYYLFLFLASYWSKFTQSDLTKYVLLLSGIGFIGSLFLVYLQIWVIEAICQFCMASALTTAGIFLLSVFASKKAKNELK